MTSTGADSKLFEEVTRELLGQGLSVRFQARGASMSPAIRDGEVVQVTPVIVSKLRKDDIVLTRSKNGFRLHRIVLADPAKDEFITRGDCGQENDPMLKGAQILGLAQAKEVRVGRKVVRANFRGVGGWTLRCAARAQRILSKIVKPAASNSSQMDATGPARTSSHIFLGAISLLLMLRRRLVLERAGRGGCHDVQFSATMTRHGSHTLTFTHTTAATANRVMHRWRFDQHHELRRDCQRGRDHIQRDCTEPSLERTTMRGIRGGWRCGTCWRPDWNSQRGRHGNMPAACNEGVAGRRDNVYRRGSDGAAGHVSSRPMERLTECNSQLDVPSVINGMILDTLAIGRNADDHSSRPAGFSSGMCSGGNNTNPGVSGTGTSRSWRAERADL